MHPHKDLESLNRSIEERNGESPQLFAVGWSFLRFSVARHTGPLCIC
jgi:hypothetical protein